VAAVTVYSIAAELLRELGPVGMDDECPVCGPAALYGDCRVAGEHLAGDDCDCPRHARNCRYEAVLRDLEAGEADAATQRARSLADAAGWLRVRAESRRRLPAAPNRDLSSCPVCPACGAGRREEMWTRASIEQTVSHFAPLALGEIEAPPDGYALDHVKYDCGAVIGRTLDDDGEATTGKATVLTECPHATALWMTRAAEHIQREIAAELEVEAMSLETAPQEEYAGTPAPGLTPTVRAAARRRQALDGADAQALESALQLTERERDEARSRIAELELLVRWTHTTYCTEAWTTRGLHAPECLCAEAGVLP